MEKNEFRVLIKHCFLMGKNTVQAQQWLEKCYREKCPSKTTICRWYADFKRGRTTTEDAERPGRPIEVATPENIKKILKIVVFDRKVKLQEIADISKISKGTVFKIMHENLGMKKLFSKWVPRLLTLEQKQQRIDDSERCLKLFTRDKKDFLRRYITTDETWIHHYTPESKRASAEWRGEGKSRPKRPKTQQSAGKIMASVFWDTHGILLIDFLPKGQTINSDYYIALLDRLDDAIKQKRPHMAKKKPLFHQDNAPIHKAMKTMVKFNDLQFELLPHPPYSPDLAPSDFYLFADLKKMLQGKRFGSDDEVIAATEAYFEAKDKSFYKKGIESLEKRWNDCIAMEGDYVDE